MLLLQLWTYISFAGLGIEENTFKLRLQPPTPVSLSLILSDSHPHPPRPFHPTETIPIHLVKATPMAQVQAQVPGQGKGGQVGQYCPSFQNSEVVVTDSL